MPEAEIYALGKLVGNLAVINEAVGGPEDREP
jgi:hypothetical protein